MNDDYPLFMKWSDTTDWILQTIERFPKSVRSTLSDRIINLTLDVLELIIETIYKKNKKEKLGDINLNIEKLRVLFRIAYKRVCISDKQYEYISILLNESGKITGGWRKSL